MQQTNRLYQFFRLAAIFLMLACIFPYMPGHPYDNLCWQLWGKNIFRNGLNHAYISDTNYLPFYQYILWIFGKLAGSEQNIEQYFTQLRCFTLLFEFWGFRMVWKWANLRISYLTLVLIGLLNIGYSYNTIVWGQADAISAAFIFAALFAGARHKYVWSSIALVLAINMKLQAIIFTPIWGLLIVHELIKDYQLRQIRKIVLVMAISQLLLFIPFATAGIAGIKPIWNILRNSSGYFSELSLNAYNLWYWVVADPTRVRNTIKPFGLVSYKTIGLLLFMASSFFALLPLLHKVLDAHKGKETSISREELWLAAALTGVLFFFCNTEMHERYAFPAFIFITAYAFYTKRFTAYILFSIAIFLNLESVIHWLHLSIYNNFIFQGKFVAFIFLIIIIYLFIMLYRKPAKPLVATKKDAVPEPKQIAIQPAS